MKVLSGQTAQTVTESGDDRSLQEKSSKFHSRAGVWKAQAPRMPSCARWLSGLREPPRDDPDRLRGHERGAR
jgi:hypothetical protein